jgi:hypothetical protein
MGKKKRIAILAILISTIIILALLRLQTVPQLALSMQESSASDTTPSRNLNITGCNKWYDPELESISDYALDLQQMKAVGFNSLRFLCPSRYVSNAATFANTVNQYYPSNIMPILFNGNGNLLDNLTIAQAESIIDIWVPLFPHVYAWEIVNEPLDNKPDSYYSKITMLIDYLHTKTSAPVTIGFHNYREDAFRRLVNSTDIISFHYYPIMCQAFGNALISSGIAEQLIRIFPELLRLTTPLLQSQQQWPIHQTYNPAADLKKTLDWLATYNKTFLISEWGYEMSDRPDLDQAESLYVQNILNVMKHCQNPNFAGYEFYCLRAYSVNDPWDGVENYERQLRPAAQWFP